MAWHKKSGQLFHFDHAPVVIVGRLLVTAMLCKRSQFFNVCISINQYSQGSIDRQFFDRCAYFALEQKMEAQIKKILSGGYSLPDQKDIFLLENSKCRPCIQNDRMRIQRWAVGLSTQTRIHKWDSLSSLSIVELALAFCNCLMSLNNSTKEWQRSNEISSF